MTGPPAVSNCTLGLKSETWTTRLGSLPTHTRTVVARLKVLFSVFGVPLFAGRTGW
jgi:hypothetical protein